jgi:glycerol uptake facilitator-like aquaporin
MQGQLATGQEQADLSLHYEQHEKGDWKLRDIQVASAEFIGTFFLCFSISMTFQNPLSEFAAFSIGAPYSALHSNILVSLC